MRYTHLLIDLDNTILDFDQAENNALRQTFFPFGVTLTDRQIANFHAINDGWWKKFEKGLTDKKTLMIGRFEDFIKTEGFILDAEMINQDYANNLSRNAPMLAGAEEVCRQLAAVCRLYIITNGTDFVQRGRWSRVPVNTLFQNIYISDELGVKKPDPLFFEKVLKDIGATDKSKVLVIGDSPSSDILGGKNAGLDTCWFDPYIRDFPYDFEPTYIVTHLEDILAVILRHEQNGFCRLSADELEHERSFFTTYFGAHGGGIYRNNRTGFSSCYITFRDGTEAEITSAPDHSDEPLPKERGVITVSVSGAHEVQDIAWDISSAGFNVFSPPREEKGRLICRMLSPGGNIIEVQENKEQ